MFTIRKYNNVEASMRVIESWKKQVFSVSLCSMLTFVCYACHDSSGDAANTDTASSEQSAQQAQPVPPPTTAVQEPRYVTGLRSLVRSGLAYEPGSYAKGQIRSGDYVFVSKNGGYFSEELNGQILDNQNFASFGYAYVHGLGDIKTDGYLIATSAVKELGVTSALDLYRAMTRQSQYNFSGVYKGGVDLPAGRYVLQSAGSAYVSVNTGPLGKADIVWNDNFNGSKSVDLQNGQYLEVDRASIVREPSAESQSTTTDSSTTIAASDETTNSQASPAPDSQVNVNANTFETSFDCNAAKSIPEYLICHDADLASSDRQLATSVQQARDAATDKALFVARIKKQWNYRERHCRDKACLQEWFSYQEGVMQRIAQSGDPSVQ